MDNLSVEYYVLSAVWCLLILIANWKIFTKAGEPGWKSIIPFYSEYTMYKFTWGNGWLFLLTLIPVVGFIAGIVQTNKLSKSFGHGVGFTIGLFLLPGIFKMIIAFSDDEYSGPAV